MVSFLDPEKIIAQLDLKQNWYAAEFGCGSGNFSIALAKVLRQGVVYALDIQEEALSALKGKAKAEGLSNIRTIQCDLEEPKGSSLRDNSLDVALVSNILFQSDNKETLLREAKRIIKPEGKIVIIDWNKDSSFGPQEGRISLEEVRQIMFRKLDVKLVKEIDADSYHWAAIFEKA